ncbi:MAG TPA: glycosyltransferase family 2 protein [Baekduia sp.]|uniref:glycosyltransferase family 2 protein n=1 Tax=Baekduia sp. TaxID=2600305 RepID=UPI002C8C0367|nr:glycosyltransferase family 2 protein [Baekduia sp.]HMJ36459.1 glycosyltransferase family 2 protein [Baekduia sp.]
MTPSVDVIIPTWCRRELLDRCLRTLATQDVEHTVVVADNASGDGTVAMLRADHPHVRVVELEQNVGFGRAVNAAVAAGSGEILVLVNNDVEVEPGFLRAIVAPFDEPVVGMVASMVLAPGRPERVDCLGLAIDRTLLVHCRLRGLPPDADVALERLAGPSGCAGAYRRAAFEQVGGFDDALFAYGDDIDVALRMRAEGWQAREARGARAIHVGGATAGIDSPWQREMAGFARGYGLRRYGVLHTAAAPRTLLLESMVVGWGLVRHRTTIPLKSRVRGWHTAAGRPRLAMLPAAVDSSITLRDTLTRVAGGR